MAKNQNRIQNFEPYHCDTTHHEGGFTMKFYAPLGEPDSGRQNIVRLTFPRWWIAYLASDLRNMLEKEREEINRIARNAGFE